MPVFLQFFTEGYLTPAFMQLAVLREQKLAAMHSEFAKQCLTEIRGDVNHSWTSLVSLQPHSTQAGYAQLRSIPSQFAVQILHLSIFTTCYVFLIDQVQLLCLSLLTINVKLILPAKLPEG